MKSFVVLVLCLPLYLSAQTPRPLKIMTSNIRLATPDDGINAWNNRKDLYIDFIKFTSVDIFGTQEVLHRQLKDIETGLPAYDHIGVGREGGKKGEYSAIFYKKDRFDILESNTFWLSEHPEEVGSMGWDAHYPRIASWAKMKDKVSGKLFYFFNTHFDHAGTLARKKSAQLILDKIKDIAGQSTVFLTGDFNVPPSAKPYKILTGSTSLALQDAFKASNKSYGPAYTFNGFQVEHGDYQRRIDYIFFRGPIKINSYQVIDGQRGKRFISDHFPVVVEVSWKDL